MLTTLPPHVCEWIRLCELVYELKEKSTYSEDLMIRTKCSAIVTVKVN